MKKPSMKKFFRIQSKYGRQEGPYHTSDSLGYGGVARRISCECQKNLYSFDRCPPPPPQFSDFSCYRYGFSSLTNLKNWFGGSIKFLTILEEEQMEIVEFETAERFDSHKQSICDKKELKRVRSVPFREINKKFA